MFKVKKDHTLLEFKRTLEVAQTVLNNNQHISLDSIEHPIYRIIHIFGKTIQSKYMQEVVIKEEYCVKNTTYTEIFLPRYEALNLNNIPSELSETNVEIDMDLSKELVFSFPWNQDRFLSALSNLNRDNWVYQENNHWAYYFEPMKIGVVYNGMHSSTIGILLNKGNIKAEVIDISNYFELIKTDGQFFYDIKNNKKIEKVDSFEQAIIFEIGRLIHLMKQH